MRCDRGDDPADHQASWWSSTGEAKLGHCAWEVADFDDLMVGHDHLLADDAATTGASAATCSGVRCSTTGRTHSASRSSTGPTATCSTADRPPGSHRLLFDPISQWGPTRPPTWTSDGPRHRGSTAIVMASSADSAWRVPSRSPARGCTWCSTGGTRRRLAAAVDELRAGRRRGRHRRGGRRRRPSHPVRAARGMSGARHPRHQQRRPAARSVRTSGTATTGSAPSTPTCWPRCC